CSSPSAPRGATSPPRSPTSWPATTALPPRPPRRPRPPPPPPRPTPSATWTPTPATRRDSPLIAAKASQGPVVDRVRNLLRRIAASASLWAGGLGAAAGALFGVNGCGWLVPLILAALA